MIWRTCLYCSQWAHVRWFQSWVLVCISMPELNSKTPAMHVIIWGAYSLYWTSATTERITTNWLLLRVRVRVVNWVIFLIESGTNSAWNYYWVECLHLVLSCAGETRNTSTASSAVTHWNWVEQTVLSGVSAYCCMLERHTTQALHLLWLIESGTNSICWMECLHLVLLRAGETSNTSTVSTAMTHWKWNKQCLFILLLIKWSICILPLVGETHNTSTAASTVTHWKWNKQYLLLLLSGMSELSIIAACWRDTQHKHCIYCRDHWRPDWWHHMTIFKYPLNKSAYSYVTWSNTQVP